MHGCAQCHFIYINDGSTREKQLANTARKSSTSQRNVPSALQTKTADNNGHSLFHLLLHQIQLLLLNNNNNREPAAAKAIQGFKHSSVITLMQTDVFFPRTNQRACKLKVFSFNFQLALQDLAVHLYALQCTTLQILQCINSIILLNIRLQLLFALSLSCLSKCDRIHCTRNSPIHNPL